MTDAQLDLEITRIVAAPRSKIWQVWSDPDILKQWWCPKPWVTEIRAFEFRSFGALHTYMSGPDGNGSEDPGLFLDVTPMERIVFTSTLTAGWRPATPFIAMTAIITLADAGANPRYTARCLHKDTEDRKKHEEMGFFDGWGTMISQMEEAAQSLP